VATSEGIGKRHWAVLVVVHLLVGVVAFIGGISLMLRHAWLGGVFAWISAAATAVSYFGRRSERKDSPP
jgi:hypothetical protein